MSIKVFLNTRNIDYSGHRELAPHLEIRDDCLKLHCYEKFSDELIQVLNIHRVNGVKQRVGIWYLVAKR